MVSGREALEVRARPAVERQRRAAEARHTQEHVVEAFDVDDLSEVGRRPVALDQAVRIAGRDERHVRGRFVVGVGGGSRAQVPVRVGDREAEPLDRAAERSPALEIGLLRGGEPAGELGEAVANRLSGRLRGRVLLTLALEQLAELRLQLVAERVQLAPACARRSDLLDALVQLGAKGVEVGAPFGVMTGGVLFEGRLELVESAVERLGVGATGIGGLVGSTGLLCKLCADGLERFTLGGCGSGRAVVDLVAERIEIGVPLGGLGGRQLGEPVVEIGEVGLERLECLAVRRRGFEAVRWISSRSASRSARRAAACVDASSERRWSRSASWA